MKTQLLDTLNGDFEKSIAVAGEILKNGGLVAIPTETVYGLAANALNEEAVKSIYVAKGRPGDNPLIVHIADFEDILPLVKEIPPSAKLCMEKFWPGPFTAVLKKSDLVPKTVSGGLDTVAVRMPNHQTARRIIKSSGCPLAAPSANLSGSPSPTTAKHCIDDLFGKVDGIVLADDCRVGVESTVVSFAVNPPRLLRPGGITAEQLRELVPDLVIDEAVLKEPEKNQKVASPGMKYKHYSPLADVTMAEGNTESFVKYCNMYGEEYDLVLCFNEDALELKGIKHLTYGGKKEYSVQAESLFARLREIDRLGVKKVLADAPEKEGMGLAVYNRLIRAAGFKVIYL